MLPRRTELLGCYSDKDFLAKLHCVRQAFEVGVGQGARERGVGDGAGRQVSLSRWVTCSTPWTALFMAGGDCQQGNSPPPPPFRRAFWKTRVTSFSSGRSAGRW